MDTDEKYWPNLGPRSIEIGNLISHLYLPKSVNKRLGILSVKIRAICGLIFQPQISQMDTDKKCYRIPNLVLLK